MRGKYPEQQRNHGDAAQRDGIGKVHVKSFTVAVLWKCSFLSANFAEKMKNLCTQNLRELLSNGPD
jgi:hypothetical protein